MFIEHPLKIVQMRTHLVLAESRMPSELARMFRGLENNQNPWGIGSDKRMEWAEGLEVPVMAEKGEAEYLAWIGCAGSFFAWTRREHASCSARNPPQIDAVRVPPSACSASQSTVICTSASIRRSVTARSERPMSRWIS